MLRLSIVLICLAGIAHAQNLPASARNAVAAFASVCLNDDISKNAFRARAKAAEVRYIVGSTTSPSTQPTFQFQTIAGNKRYSQCSLRMRGKYFATVAPVAIEAAAQAGLTLTDRQSGADDKGRVERLTYRKGADRYMLTIYETDGKRRGNTVYVKTTGAVLVIHRG